MLEKIAMWGGVAGIVIALFAIIILYLTRSNIIDLLDRDVIMYDTNYESKKESLQEAFNCLDLVAQNGVNIKNNPQYVQRAKEAYNGLLCTLYSPKLYQEFYRLAVDKTTAGYTIQDIEKFKISCRAELIAKRKNKHEGFKGVTFGALDEGMMSTISQPISQQPQRQQPAKPRPQQRPAQPQARPQNKPQQPAQPQDNDEI